MCHRAGSIIPCLNYCDAKEGGVIPALWNMNKQTLLQFCACIWLREGVIWDRRIVVVILCMNSERMYCGSTLLAGLFYYMLLSFRYSVTGVPPPNFYQPQGVIIVYNNGYSCSKLEITKQSHSHTMCVEEAAHHTLCCSILHTYPNTSAALWLVLTHHVTEIMYCDWHTLLH